jgi:hypothetical protein
LNDALDETKNNIPRLLPGLAKERHPMEMAVAEVGTSSTILPSNRPFRRPAPQSIVLLYVFDPHSVQIPFS